MTWRGMLASLKALGVGPPRFRFRVGAVVCWVDSPEPALRWQIVARRYTDGEVSAYVKYLLVLPSDPTTPAMWGYEPDLEEMP